MRTTSRLDTAEIERAQAVAITEVARERGLVLKRSGNELAGPCPHCGGRDRFSISVRKNVFLCRQCMPKGGGTAIDLVMFLDGCHFRNAVETLIGQRHASTHDTPAAAANNLQNHNRRQHQKASWLWSQCHPITGTIAETYLRTARGITCSLPPTLGFLPQRKPDQHPAMIAAFGLCDEIEPGVIIAPRHVQAVHLTLLKPDGSGKADTKPNKIMVGSPGGFPIVIAPANDLLGLAITEGIEDGLSAHQALGLGAWAAGAATFMPKLADALPGYIEAVTIYAHADKAGRDGAHALAAVLRSRDIEVTMEGI